MCLAEDHKEFLSQNKKKILEYKLINFIIGSFGTVEFGLCC